MADKNAVTAVDEEKLGALGKIPTTLSTGDIDLNLELVSRWDFWLRSGLPKEEK